MGKEGVITLRGEIVDCLPNATFKVKLENDHEIFGVISGKIRRFNINILMGDSVDVEMTPYDLTKGRIVFRHKT